MISRYALHMTSQRSGHRRSKRYPYAAVLFDLDGTLGNRHSAVRRWAEEFYFSQPGLMARVEREVAVNQIVEWDAGGHVFAPELFNMLVETWPFVREGAEELVEWHAVHYPAAFKPETRDEPDDCPHDAR